MNMKALAPLFTMLQLQLIVSLYVLILLHEPQTSEVDDSISVLGPNHVAIHIADPTSFIPLGSELDFNASLR